MILNSWYIISNILYVKDAGERKGEKKNKPNTS